MKLLHKKKNSAPKSHKEIIWGSLKAETVTSQETESLTSHSFLLKKERETPWLFL